MSALVVVGYQDIHKAEEVRLLLWKLQRDYLLDLEDVVVVVKNAKGKVKLHQALDLTSADAINRRILGRTDWFNIPESAAGFGRGCISERGFGRSHQRRNQRRFYEGTRCHFDTLQFVTVRSARNATAAPYKVLEELKGTGGTTTRNHH